MKAVIVAATSLEVSSADVVSENSISQLPITGITLLESTSIYHHVMDQLYSKVCKLEMCTLCKVCKLELYVYTVQWWLITLTVEPGMNVNFCIFFAFIICAPNKLCIAFILHTE